MFNKQQDNRRGPEHRINERIRARFVRLIDEKGENLGTLPIMKAQAIAYERGFDLVEMQANANPPVCRLLDYGKFRYEEKKQQKSAKKKHHVQEEKEVRFRVNTADHDVQTKIRHAKDFLEHGDKVIFSIVMRGRENEHRDMARAIFDKVKAELLPLSKIEKDVFAEGNRMSLVLLPLPKQGGGKPRPPASTAAVPAAPKPSATPPTPPPANTPPKQA
jgi:translation initiation factor IF-3